MLDRYEVVNFYEVVNIDQYPGQRGWRVHPITARNGIYR
jgi:hypothetical protein